jgi:hypothetical protein
MSEHVAAIREAADVIEHGGKFLDHDALNRAARHLEELEAALDSEHATVGAGIWHFWSDKAQQMAQRNALLAIERNEAERRAAEAERKLEQIRMVLRGQA